jgi:type IV secretion system protein TrbL
MRIKTASFRITKGSLLLGIVLAFAFAFVNAENAVASPADPDILGRISNTFYNKAEGWASVLEQAAYTIFHYLIIIDICLFGIRGALDIKTGAPIGSLAGEFTLFILFAAFMYTCIKYYKEWSNQVIDGFIHLANNAGGNKVEEGDIFRLGLDIARNIWDAMTVKEIFLSIAFLISGLILLFCFVLMAAEMLLIKCESFIVMNAGIVLLGFGGMRYFKDYSINL